MQNPDPNEDAIKPVVLDGLAAQYLADYPRSDDTPLDSSTVNDTHYDPWVSWNATNFTSSNSSPSTYPIDSRADTKGLSSFLEGTRDESLTTSNTSILLYASDDPSGNDISNVQAEYGHSSLADFSSVGIPNRTGANQIYIVQRSRDRELTTTESSKRLKPDSGSDDEGMSLPWRIRSDHSGVSTSVNSIQLPDRGSTVRPPSRARCDHKWVDRDLSPFLRSSPIRTVCCRRAPSVDLLNHGGLDLYLLPTFAQKLYTMVQDPRGRDLVYWTLDGTCFGFQTGLSFVTQVLKVHFQTCDLRTLVEQLERHGFRQKNQDTPHFYGDNSLKFSHPKFLRGRPELLVDITANSQEVTPARPVAVSSAGPPLIRGSFRGPPPNSTLSYKVDELVDQTTENHKLTAEIKSLGQQLEEERAENNALREMLKRLTGSVKKTMDSPLEMDQIPSPSPQAPLSNEIPGYSSISGPSWQPVDNYLHGVVNATEYIQPVGGPMDSGTEVLHKATDPVAAENTDRLTSRIKTRTLRLIQSFTPKKGGK